MSRLWIATGLFLCATALALVMFILHGDTSVDLGRFLERNLSRRSRELYSDEIPPDKRVLGRATWTAFHTLAANYPDEPTPTDKEHALAFVNALTTLYPCKLCRDHFDRYVSVRPPEYVYIKNIL